MNQEGPKFSNSSIQLKSTHCCCSYIPRFRRMWAIFLHFRSIRAPFACPDPWYDIFHKELRELEICAWNRTQALSCLFAFCRLQTNFTVFFYSFFWHRKFCEIWLSSTLIWILIHWTEKHPCMLLAFCGCWKRASPSSLSGPSSLVVKGLGFKAFPSSFVARVFIYGAKVPPSEYVEHCLDFSFVFSAPLHAWRNLFSASETFCGGRYWPGRTGIFWRAEGTSQPVTISKKWKIPALLYVGNGPEYSPFRDFDLFSRPICWGTDLKSRKGLYSGPSTIFTLPNFLLLLHNKRIQ